MILKLRSCCTPDSTSHEIKIRYTERAYPNSNTKITQTSTIMHAIKAGGTYCVLSILVQNGTCELTCYAR